MRATAIVIALLAQSAWAQPGFPSPAKPGQGNVEASALPEQLKDTGIDQKIGAKVPLDLVFTGEDGVKRPLREFVSDRPAILALVYYECPMLCNMVLQGVLRSVRAMPLEVGRDFDIIAVSFDPAETPTLALDKKKEFVARYQRPGGERGWRFLTGDAENIRRITSAAGFRYRWDDKANRWIHASGVMILTPGGVLSKYFYGVEYSARDLRLGLVEASQGRVGNPVDQILLYCFHYDPALGKYSLLVLRVLRIAAVATVLGLILFWYFAWRSGKRNNVQLPAIS